MPDQQSSSQAAAIAAPAPHSRRSLDRWLLYAALLLIFLLYVRVIGFAPVYDDNLIGEWGKLSDIPSFFTHDIFGSDGVAHSVYYRPLPLTYGLLLGYCTQGLPGGSHLAAIFLLLIAFWLAYRLGCRLFQDEKFALLAALLFALHPSKVESTAWIGSSLVDGLSGIFFLASLLAFMNSTAETRWLRWRAASVFLFACAVFSKETMVVLPAILAVQLWTASPRAGRMIRVLKALLPYAVVGAVYLAIRHQVIRPPKADVTYVHPTFTHSYLWTAPYSLWWYLRHLAWPSGLAVQYDNLVLDQPTLYGFWLPAAALLLLLVVACWLWSRRRSGTALFLACWFVLVIAPAVVVAPMVREHDRYLFLASYPFCALVAWLVLHLKPPMRSVAAFALVVLLSGLTWHETSFWDDDYALWGRAYQISPRLVTAEVFFADQCLQRGDIAQAFAISDAGLGYHPLSPNLWLQRATLLKSAGKPAESHAAYLKVLEVTAPLAGQPLAPDLSRARAAAVFQLAKTALDAGDYAEAEHYARMAIAVKFDGVAYHAILAESLRGQGRIDEAAAEGALELRLRLAKARH
jgi:tetratricopeptide (TPR) repeat protein